MRDVSSAPRYSGLQAFQAFNPTSYAGDVLFQIPGDEIGAIQVPSIKLATKLTSIHRQLVEAGCGECAIIEVFAHSQGAMVLNRALPLLRNDVRNTLRITTIGGQTTVQGEGFAMPPENYKNYTDFLNQDWVPWANYNPLRVPSWLINGVPHLQNATPPVSNWMEHSYQPYYDPLVQSLNR